MNPPPSQPHSSPDPPPPAADSLASRLAAAVSRAFIGYSIILSLLVVALHLIGEHWWPLAILLYLPQGIFLLPLLILLPARLLAEASSTAWWSLALAGIIFIIHDPFHLALFHPHRPTELTLVTNNYGENHHLPLQPFIDAENPDFVVLQDALNQAPGFRKSYPGRTIAALGQFLLISKHPVLNAQVLAWPAWAGRPVAAVFTVDWLGRQIAIYSVHLPTPRPEFAKLTGLGLLREIAGHNRRKSDGMSFGEAMAARVELARDLNQVIAREQRPFLVAGDFNMATCGCEHHIVTRGLVDSFARCGWGRGFTFPCDSFNPLTLGGPWLRLDCVFAGPGWIPEECRVEPGRRSQHRAVVARLALGPQ